MSIFLNFYSELIRSIVDFLLKYNIMQGKSVKVKINIYQRLCKLRVLFIKFNLYRWVFSLFVI
jgi:hypothetical protein